MGVGVRKVQLLHIVPILITHPAQQAGVGLPNKNGKKKEFLAPVDDDDGARVASIVARSVLVLFRLFG